MQDECKDLENIVWKTRWEYAISNLKRLCRNHWDLGTELTRSKDFIYKAVGYAVKTSMPLLATFSVALVIPDAMIGVKYSSEKNGYVERRVEFK